MAKARRTFKPLNQKRVKENAARSNSKFDSIFQDGVNILKLKVGVNNLRIARGTDDTFWGETIHVHSYVGTKESTYLCPKAMRKAKSCPICDAADDAAQAGDKEEFKRLAVKDRMICWTIDRDDEKKGLQVWDMSGPQGQEIDTISDTKRGVLDISHPDDGFDVSIMRKGTKLATRYSGLQIDRESSPLCDDQRQQDAWVDEIDNKPLVSLLRYYDNEYLEGVLSGKIEEKDEGDEEGVDDKPRSTRGRRSEEAEEREEEEDEKPRGRGRRQEQAEEEEDERPRRSARARDSEESDDREEESDAEEAEARRWKNGRGQDSEDTKKPAARRSRASEEPEEEEERPARRSRAAEREEEEDEKPRRRGRDADDEEDERASRPTRQTSRRGTDEDEEDEKPRRSRAPRDEEEEDEKPSHSRSRSRASDDEEEEDEKPRRATRERMTRNDDEDEDERPRGRGRR